MLGMKKSDKWMDKTMVPVHLKQPNGSIVVQETSVRSAVKLINDKTLLIKALDDMALELMGQLYLDRPNNEFFDSKMCTDSLFKSAKAQALKIKQRREDDKRKVRFDSRRNHR